MNPIEQLLSDLELIVRETLALKHRAGYFAAIYRQVTVEVRTRIADGRFEDNSRMIRFAALFGSRYVDAYRSFRAGRDITGAWRVALANATSGTLIILQDLLLGINAHVNLDLGVSAAAIGLQGLKNDFEQLNDVISGLTDRAQAAINHFSPALGVLDFLGGRTDEQIVNFSLGVAREDAWHSAVLLTATPTAGLEAAIRAIDRRAALVARRVAEPGFPFASAVSVVRLSESSDVAGIIRALDTLA